MYPEEPYFVTAGFVTASFVTAGFVTAGLATGALHLNLARELEAGALATADRKMTDAAEALGFGVVGFMA